jgi:hypothetical protein
MGINLDLAVILGVRTPVSCAFVAAGRGATSRGICARRPGAATGRISPAVASVSVVPFEFLRILNCVFWSGIGPNTVAHVGDFVIATKFFASPQANID